MRGTVAKKLRKEGKRKLPRHQREVQSGPTEAEPAPEGTG